MLSYEKLDVCRCSIELLALTVEIVESIAKTKGNGVLVDQENRAAEMLTRMCHFR